MENTDNNLVFCNTCGRAFIPDRIVGSSMTCPDCLLSKGSAVSTAAHAKTLSELESKFIKLESFTLERLKAYETQMMAMDEAIRTFSKQMKDTSELLEKRESEMRVTDMSVHEMESRVSLIEERIDKILDVVGILNKEDTEPKEKHPVVKV